MRHPLRPARQRSGAATLVALGTLALALAAPGLADDRDLLRFATGKPYVYFIVDTSSSMNQGFGDVTVHANGDDRRSKLFAAKQAIYETLADVNDVHLGFASFNQDALQVRSKHWLYYHNTALPGGWPFTFPALESDDAVEVPVCEDVNGDPIDCSDPGATIVDYDVDIDGDLWTFGEHFAIGTVGQAGTCDAPLALGALGDANRETLNRFAKSGTGTTTLWISSGGRTFRMRILRPAVNPSDGSPNGVVGDAGFVLGIALARVSSCLGPTFDVTYDPALLRFQRYTDFLTIEDPSPPTDEELGGYWDWQDVAGTAVCDAGHPFSGRGWEGNYDGVNGYTPDPGNLDPSCDTLDGTCYNLKRPRSEDPAYSPELDRGDMIPFDWRVDNKDDFLSRLAPNHGAGSPDYRVATYFQNDPDGVIGIHKLRNETMRPLVGFGESGIAKALADFRCFYLGSNANKCNTDVYPDGFEAIAEQVDSEWGCRRPYLIVVSDGHDTCPGENPAADTANLNAKAGIRSWSIALVDAGVDVGDPGYDNACKNAAGNPLHSISRNGKGELICAKNPDVLKEELERILGIIREEARTFASAAVPTVQATVTDKVFLTNFTPLNGKSSWDGHIHNFLKPVPRDVDTNKPDLDHERHVWDAGEVLLTQAADPPMGDSVDNRRVYYTELPASGEEWALLARRHFFQALENDGSSLPDPRRYDLWRGFGLIPADTVDGSLTDAEETTHDGAADAVVDTTLAVKSDVVDGTPIEYLLGDIFHSNPLVVSTPANTIYFAKDVPEYREFTRRHKNRRKMLVVGTNEGMLHAFDAGIFHEGVDADGDPIVGEGEFDNGTGKEIFAVVPRGVMPAVVALASSTAHRFTVDGSPIGNDVFIDPLHDGTPTPDEREWRTVLITGLREGGSSYFALDITQPDQYSEVTDANGITQFVPDDGVIPSCLDDISADCSPVPFPAMLWEFNDSVRDASDNFVRLNEDGLDGDGDGAADNTEPDLGFTWSPVTIGRIRICNGTDCSITADPTTSADLGELHVAVFGGGNDPLNKSQTGNTTTTRGNWIYMVDIETGNVIFKRKVVGSVPSDAAAVDTDSDGFLDRIYAATLAGFVYRVDLLPKADSNYPSLEDTTVLALDGFTYTVQRVNKVDSGGNPVLDTKGNSLWEPRQIFDANVGATIAPRSIYHRPSVIFSARLGKYALAFGTGDREDLWSSNDEPGRFYLFVDDSDVGSVTLPMDENDLQIVGVTDDPAGIGNDFIFDRAVGERGWAITLDADERVITNSFALSGVTIFSTYQPTVDIFDCDNPPPCDTDGDGDFDDECPPPHPCDTDGDGDFDNQDDADGNDPLCSKTGTSRVFVLFTTNADPVLEDTAGDLSRLMSVSTFVTEAFAEQALTKNEPTDDTDANYDTPTDAELAARERLKALQPSNCKYGNQSIEIKTVDSLTQVHRIVPVPVCLIEKNWKEF